MLPVYASLPTLAAERRHPFSSAERCLVDVHARSEGEGLSALLFEQAEQGRVWLLLDGLDEVAPGEDRAWVEEQLGMLSESGALARIPIAVFSRPVGFKQLPTYPNRARIRALNERQQEDLLTRWLGDAGRAAALQRHIRQSPGLRELCGAPLLLSLLALLVKHGAEGATLLPANRASLYEGALRMLLLRGHQGATRGVRNPGAAYRVLAELCVSSFRSPWARSGRRPS